MLLPVRHPAFRLLATLPCVFLLAAGPGMHHHGIAGQIAEWWDAWGHHCCHHAHASVGEERPDRSEHDPDDCEVCRFYAQAKWVSISICVRHDVPLNFPETVARARLFPSGHMFSPASPRGPPSAG